MKRTFLVLCLGIMIGALGSTAAGAIAAIGDKVEATVTQFVFIVNGEEKQVDVDPLIVQGTSYLPVRTVSNMLGYDVTYKAPTEYGEIAKILLNKTVESLAAETNYVLEQEVEPVQVIDAEAVTEQIKKIDDQIRVLTQGIRSIEIGLGSDRESEETKAKLQSGLEEYENKISELEAQKAELEAQLPTE